MAYQAKTKAEDLGVQEYILTLEPAGRRDAHRVPAIDLAAIRQRCTR